ncbi:MAG: hypothetical protein JOZ24_05260, partial [Candidatus Eremiobacteraeota bacterium]|nr:hypothetical protein [Candidatus Eremiobacteraeota bacterium]
AGGLPLNGGSGPVDRITRNLIGRLTADAPAAIAIANPYFEDWDGDVPSGWNLDGAGNSAAVGTDPDDVADYLRFYDDPADFALQLDATKGETWISASNFTCRAGTLYGAGCWIKAARPGATIRLQTTDTWADFASAAHAGDGAWEYVFAIGTPPGSGNVPCRVKLQLASGATAQYENVSVIPLE